MKKGLPVLALLLCAICSINAQSLPGTADQMFNPQDIGYPSVENPSNGVGDGFDAAVSDFDTLSDGKFICVGQFTKFNGIKVGHIVMLDRGGNQDTTFNYNLPGANAEVKAVKVLPSDSIMVVGAFTTYNGTTVSGVVLMDKYGNVNQAFNATIQGAGISNGTAVNIDNNGQYIIAWSNQVGNTKVSKISKTGFADATFATNTGVGFGGYTTSQFIRKLYIDNNNKIIVCGLFSNFNGVTSSRCILRLNNDGTKDLTFNPTGLGALPVTVSPWYAGVYDIKPISGGRYVIAGAFDNYYGVNVWANGLIVINADGSRDTTFHDMVYYGDTTLRITAIAVQNDGKILACGQLFVSPPLSNPYRILKIDTTGRLESVFVGTNFTFGALGTDDLPFHKAIIRNDKLIVTGNFTKYAFYPRNRMMMFKLSGGISPKMYGYTGANGTVQKVCVIPDNDTIPGNNDMYVIGNFNRYNSYNYSSIVKVKADGSVDSTFITYEGFGSGTGSYPTASDIAIDSTGKIYVVGNFTTYMGYPSKNIIRLNPNGSIDNTFIVGTGFNSAVYDIKLLPGGKLLVGGFFSSYKGVSQGRIVRLLYDGSVDPTFVTGTGFDKPVYSIEVVGNNYFVGGGFTTYNGQAKIGLAKLNPDGSLNTAFTPNPPFNFSFYNGVTYKYVAAIAQLDSSSIVVGGTYFQGTDTVNLRYLNKYNLTTGVMDATFNVPMTFNPQNYIVGCVKKQADGKLLIGGHFYTIQGQLIRDIARLLPNGTIDTSFAIGGGVVGLDSAAADNKRVNDITLLDDSKIMVSGAFSRINGKRHSSIAKLENNILLTGEPGDTLLRFNPDYCQGATINVPVTAMGDFGVNNSFIIQISDNTGSFASPTTIGTVNTNYTTNVSATLPFNFAVGTGYKVRAISTSPYIVGTTASAVITVTQSPAQPGAYTTSTDTVMQGQTNVPFSVPLENGVNYLWTYTGTGATVNGTGNSVTVDFSNTATSGTLNVSIVEDGCPGEPQVVDVTVLELVDIATNLANTLDAYSNKNTIVINAQESYQFSLYDLSGRLVLPMKKLQAGRTDIDVSTIANGIYIVRLNNAKGAITRKIVVSN